MAADPKKVNSSSKGKGKGKQDGKLSASASAVSQRKSMLTEEQVKQIKTHTEKLIKNLNGAIKHYGDDFLKDCSHDEIVNIVNAYYSEIVKIAGVGDAVASLCREHFEPALEVFKEHCLDLNFDPIRAAMLAVDTWNSYNKNASGWLRQNDAISKKLFTSRFWGKKIKVSEIIGRMRAIFELAFSSEKARNACKESIGQNTAENFYSDFVENINRLFFPETQFFFNFEYVDEKDEKATQRMRVMQQAATQTLGGIEGYRAQLKKASDEEAGWWITTGEVKGRAFASLGANEVVQGTEFVSAIQQSFGSVRENDSHPLEMKVKVVAGAGESSSPEKRTLSATLVKDKEDQVGSPIQNLNETDGFDCNFALKVAAGIGLMCLGAALIVGAALLGAGFLGLAIPTGGLSVLIGASVATAACAVGGVLIAGGLYTLFNAKNTSSDLTKSESLIDKARYWAYGKSIGL